MRYIIKKEAINSCDECPYMRVVSNIAPNGDERIFHNKYVCGKMNAILGSLELVDKPRLGGNRNYGEWKGDYTGRIPDVCPLEKVDEIHFRGAKQKENACGSSDDGYTYDGRYCTCGECEKTDEYKVYMGEEESDGKTINLS